MIDIKYKLTEVDFLQLHLYIHDVEGSLRKISRKVIFLFLIIITIFIIFLTFKNDIIYAFLLALTAFFILLFHKQTMKKQFEKNLKKTIQPYKNRFNKFVELKFTENEIEVRSIAGNTQFYISQIKTIIETKEYFFIRLQPEVIIIPKRELENPNKTNEHLHLIAENLILEFKKDFKWKW